MSTVSSSLLIAKSPNEVWQALARFDAISAWAPDVDHSSAASEAREGVGAVRRVQLGRITLLEQVTRWQPAQQLSYQITGLPPAAGTVETSWDLVASPGGTLTTVTTTINPLPGPPGKIVGRVLARRMGGATTKMLSGLAQHVEETS